VQPVNAAEPILPVLENADIAQHQYALDSTEIENSHSVPVAEKARRRFSWAALISVLPGLLLILLTFLAQVLYLMDIDSGTVYDVLKQLWLTK
jgi:hypothetical protein